jgi:hypothetical protein
MDKQSSLIIIILLTIFIGLPLIGYMAVNLNYYNFIKDYKINNKVSEFYELQKTENCTGQSFTLLNQINKLESVKIIEILPAKDVKNKLDVYLRNNFEKFKIAEAYENKVKFLSTPLNLTTEENEKLINIGFERSISRCKEKKNIKDNMIEDIRKSLSNH